MNANEDMNKEKLAIPLKHLGMRDVAKERTGEKGTSAYLWGKNQIDEIWSTKDIECHESRFIPLWSGIGDHRAC